METKSKRVAVIGVGEVAMFDEGARIEVMMPSGFKASIRETNGEDEDLLSKIGDAKGGTNFYKYLANLVEIDGKKVTFEEIKKWKVRDIYYGLLKARMLAHGNVVAFDHEFVDGVTLSYTEDLGFYDWDLSKAEKPPKIGEKDYDKRIIQPYVDNSEWFEFTTSTNKKCRAKFLTGEDELKTVTSNIDDLSVNDKFRIRDFQVLKSGGAWDKVERFNIFTARETAELRTKLENVDPEFTMSCEVRNDKGVMEEVSLLTVPGFFFPRA